MVVEVTFLGMRNPILGRLYIYINMDICEKKFGKSLVVVHIITYLCNREKNHAHEYKDHDKDVSRVFQDQPVLKAWLFGSFARGEETSKSDVDLLVEFDKNARVSLMKHAGMIVDLERKLRRPVDLVTDGTLLPFAVESANRDKILIYERASKG